MSRLHREKIGGSGVMETILKMIFLVIAIATSFKNIVQSCRGFKISAFSTWSMAISIVGFIAIQFDWVNL